MGLGCPYPSSLCHCHPWLGLTTMYGLGGPEWYGCSGCGGGGGNLGLWLYWGGGGGGGGGGGQNGKWEKEQIGQILVGWGGGIGRHWWSIIDWFDSVERGGYLNLFGKLTISPHIIYNC